MKNKCTSWSVVVVLAVVGCVSTVESLGDSPVALPPPGKEDSLMMAFGKWFAIGTAVPGSELNQAERQLLFKNFGTITPENCMKPAPVHPAEDRFDFAKADALVEMARANGLTVNGHTLVWHQQCPDWFFSDGGQIAGRELVLKRLRIHIAAVAGHFAGRMKSWDVVNEAIDGVGIQGHWQIDRIPFKDIEDAIIAFHSEGMQVMITELDIDVVTRKTAGSEAGLRERDGADPFANGLSDDLQQRLAVQYAKLFGLFLKHRDKITRVTFWGLHDGRSWLNYWPSKRTNHPLLWDRALQSKPALSAVLAVTREKTGQNAQPKPDGDGLKPAP